MNKYFVGIYCPPYPPLKNNGVDRQTKEVFSILKNAGVEHIYGHLEDEYLDYTLIDKSMNICDELSLKYYPRPSICAKFLKVGIENAATWHKGEAFLNLDEKEQQKLLNNFINEMKHYSLHESFGGVMFGDESPMPTFKAIGMAREAFHSSFPDKEFHYNLLNYMMSDEIMYGSTDPKYVLKGDLECKSENRFNRYNYFLKNYFENVNVETLSMDAYPYTYYWDKLPTTIHRCLHETSALFAEYKNSKPGLRIMNYIQLGGWDKSVRITNKAEIALNINVQLAYNGDGFIFFPGVTPNDFINDPNVERKYLQGNMGFVDDQGHETRYVSIVRPIIDQAQMVAPYILNSSFKGVYLDGEFYSGFDKNVKLNELPDYDAIYVGQEMPFAKYSGVKADIDFQYQILVGVFEDDKHKYFMVVNNTIVTENRIKINENLNTVIISGKERKIQKGDEIVIPPGEMILLF